ncbi:hypothetical protein B0H21DRAFT_793233, partial [Amylocystis lapponica]
MFSSSRKRKYKPQPSQQADHERLPPDSSLFIQAYEADLIRGPQAARSLEIVHDNARRLVEVGDSLIRWTGSVCGPGASDDDEEDIIQLGRKVAEGSSKRAKDDSELWVDRYDARLLLDILPVVPSESSLVEPGSPTGWSDLPSDAEDTFFFSLEEVDDYHREKRRRMLARDREERMNAMPTDAADEARDEEELWGGSDEEPDEPQRELMRRTASHILGSPNPAQLEMRILANHGADRRFAFLRGRWARAWKIAKGRTRLDLEQTEKAKHASASLVSLGGLAGYGDSDEEGSDDALVEHQAEDPVANGLPDTGTLPNSVNDGAGKEAASDDEVKKARRARAKEWAEKRRAVK